MVAVVIAAAVTVTMTTDTAEAADHAAVAVMAAEVADHPLPITEVVHEGTIARGQDLTHLVSYSFFKFAINHLVDRLRHARSIGGLMLPFSNFKL